MSIVGYSPAKDNIENCFGKNKLFIKNTGYFTPFALSHLATSLASDVPPE